MEPGAGGIERTLLPALSPFSSNSANLHVSPSQYFCPTPYCVLAMSSLTTHFARRGLELAHGAVAGNDDHKLKVSPTTALVVFITCLAFFVLFAAVSSH